MGLDLVEIVLEVEEEFDVQLNHHEPPLLVGELFEMTLAPIRKQYSDKMLADDDVWIAMRNLIADQLGLPNERVTREANFVTDLGCS